MIFFFFFLDVQHFDLRERMTNFTACYSEYVTNCQDSWPIKKEVKKAGDVLQTSCRGTVRVTNGGSFSAHLNMSCQFIIQRFIFKLTTGDRAADEGSYFIGLGSARRP